MKQFNETALNATKTCGFTENYFDFKWSHTTKTIQIECCKNQIVCIQLRKSFRFHINWRKKKFSKKTTKNDKMERGAKSLLFAVFHPNDKLTRQRTLKWIFLRSTLIRYAFCVDSIQLDSPRQTHDSYWLIFTSGRNKIWLANPPLLWLNSLVWFGLGHWFLLQPSHMHIHTSKAIC